MNRQAETMSQIGPSGEKVAARRGIAAWLRQLDTKRVDRATCMLLFLLALAAWLPRASGPIDMRWDGGAYYNLGTSLTQGHGYRLLSEPGSPKTTLHPPLLPMFIAAHQLILGTTDPLIVGRALRVSGCLLFGLQAVAIYILLRAFVAPAAALLAAIFWICHPMNTWNSDTLYAELLFGL